LNDARSLVTMGPDGNRARHGRRRAGRPGETIIVGRGIDDARSGRLDVVATPIGNLGDLSPRAREALESADLIAAEDTRRTAQLLAVVGVQRPLVSLHAHNERERVADLVARLLQGGRIALVSDAGTPLLSDPGFALVRAAVGAGVDVRAVPGPTAIAAALSIAGIPTDRFTFEGFLPVRPRERRTALERLAGEARTMVFFEAPHRIAAALHDLAATLGAERQAALAREITKIYETTYRGTLEQLAQRATTDEDMARGEITIVVAGAPQEDAGDAARERTAELLARTVRALAPHLPPSRIAAVAAQISGARRADAYALALRMLGPERGDGAP
jgi:16S rRNA (cytidine1402-2'-O)-methyltransferase